MFSGIIPYLLTAGGAIVAILGLVFKSRLDGARLERAKHDAEKLKAAEGRLEMHREATDAERKATGMSDSDARAEAMKWAKK